jgi:hypothetical protein
MGSEYHWGSDLAVKRCRLEVDTYVFTVEDTYTEGKVELKEIPTGLTYAKVLATFLLSSPAIPHRFMVYGQFADSPMSTEEDFRIAE